LRGCWAAALELGIVKSSLLLVAALILMGCTSDVSQQDITCRAKCSTCEGVELECRGERDIDSKRVSP
jgi:hypothetical protein